MQKSPTEIFSALEALHLGLDANEDDVRQAYERLSHDSGNPRIKEAFETLAGIKLPVEIGYAVNDDGTPFDLFESTPSPTVLPEILQTPPPPEIKPIPLEEPAPPPQKKERAHVSGILVSGLFMAGIVWIAFSGQTYIQIPKIFYRESITASYHAAKESFPLLRPILAEPAEINQAVKAETPVPHEPEPAKAEVPELQPATPEPIKNPADQSLKELEKLAETARTNPESLTALGNALKSDSESVRRRAVELIAPLSPKSKLAFSYMLRAARDPERNVSQTAVLELWNRKILLKETVPILRQALKNKDAFYRLRAARALGQIGIPAKDAVPDLTGMIRDSNLYVRRRASAAIEQIKAEWDKKALRTE